MLRCIALAVFVATVTGAHGLARESDHLRRGEKKIGEPAERDYRRAVQTILARGWRADVVVRMLDIPAGPPEAVVGIARTRAGYQAFETKAPVSLWGELTYTSDTQLRVRHDYGHLHPVLHKRPVSQALSARIAALWRHVLADPRNYRDETRIYTDANVFTFALHFSAHEHFTAHSTGTGTHTEQLVLVARAIGDYTRGAPESELSKAVSKAERAIGI